MTVTLIPTVITLMDPTNAYVSNYIINIYIYIYIYIHRNIGAKERFSWDLTSSSGSFSLLSEKFVLAKG